MTAACESCKRTLVEGESAWAKDWSVVEAGGVRMVTRYTCDECEASR